MFKGSFRTLFCITALTSAPFAHSANVIDLKGKSLDILQPLLASQAPHQLKMSKTVAADQLKVASKITDSQNITHTVYQQYHNGLPIYGKVIATHEPANLNRVALTQSRNAVVMNGQLVQNLAADLPKEQPSLSQDAAIAFAKQRFLRFRKIAQPVFTQVQAKQVYFIDEQQKAHLAYAVSFMVDDVNQGKPAKPIYLIDAHSKQVLKTVNQLKTNFPAQAMGDGGNEKTGHYTYGKDFDFLDITVDGNTCYLENHDVKTVDLNHAEYAKDGSAYHFSCEAPSYQHSGDAYEGSYSVQDDAHFFGEVIEHMYQQWYQTDALNFQLVMRVHYGDHYENAFWDGETMSFGDGDQMFYPLVALDVAAHEVSHGFTAQHANLEYDNQSGAINEAFSDMAGKTAEYFMHGRNNWGLGGEITKNGFGATCGDGSQGALRCMDTPEADGQSIGDARDYNHLLVFANEQGQAYVKYLINEYQLDVDPNWLDHPPSRMTPDLKDLLDQLREARENMKQGILVHTASGVFNRAFYFLATTPDWDTKKAFHVFVYANQNHYWTPTSNFADAAYGTIQAARALQYDSQAVRDAFEKVGIICDDAACHIGT